MSLVAAASLAYSTLSLAQFPPPPSGPPKPAQETAPVDFTGYWVSIVTEDWRTRQFVPKKGDFGTIPMNPEGLKVANAWDAAKVETGEDKCKLYGGANIMRVPGRLHITWADKETLKIEADAGTQTRTLNFNKPAPATSPAPSRQGYSTAKWDGRNAMRVETSALTAGYLQANGVPYSENSKVTEFFDTWKDEVSGDQWMLVKIIVEDPKYLRRTYIVSPHFRMQKDAKGWNPTPCL
jgi:hypothetical protein